MKKELTGKTAALCTLVFLLLAQPQAALADEGFSFRDVENLVFYFSSGAGAWRTEMIIDADGTFSGEYSDSDMGDRTEEYPNGTLYLCSFTGQFSQPEKINDYTYSVKITDVSTAQQAGVWEIRDGIRYIYSEPYGLDGTDEMLFYLAGAPLAELPKDFCVWVRGSSMLETDATTLPFIGLCNPVTEYGFSSYETDRSSSSATTGIDNELAEIEAQAIVLEDRINSGTLSQNDLNQTAADLYTLWDDELNSLWGRIREVLPEDEMEQLTSDELDWIEYKEAAAAQAGAEFEGGSMQPFIEYTTAADLTRERVYYLAEYLGYTGNSASAVTAEEPLITEQTVSDASSGYAMNSDTDYLLDLDGDGNAERFSYSTYTAETEGSCNAVLELFVDGQKIWTTTDESWSYFWRVSHGPSADGSTLLIACSESDNDYTNQALLLQKNGDSFSVLADLCALTRKSDALPNQYLSSWARIQNLSSVDGASFTLAWNETLMSTGLISVPVSYEIINGQAIQTSVPSPLDAQKEWTAWTAFYVMDGAGSDAVSFRVSPGETVWITELTNISGRSWLKCRNSLGQEGWFPDAEEYISEPGADGTYLCGYFLEALFAG